MRGHWRYVASASAALAQQAAMDTHRCCMQWVWCRVEVSSGERCACAEIIWVWRGRASRRSSDLPRFRVLSHRAACWPKRSFHSKILVAKAKSSGRWRALFAVCLLLCRCNCSECSQAERGPRRPNSAQVRCGWLVRGVLSMASSKQVPVGGWQRTEGRRQDFGDDEEDLHVLLQSVDYYALTRTGSQRRLLEHRGM